MVPYIYTATILMCLFISAQQFSGNGIVLADSFDHSMNSIDDNFNFMLKSPYLISTNYNSGNLSKLPNLVDSLSTLTNRKPNKLVSKLCNLNTVSVENMLVQMVSFLSWK